MDAAAGHQAGDRQTDRQTLKVVGAVEKKGRANARWAEDGTY